MNREKKVAIFTVLTSLQAHLHRLSIMSIDLATVDIAKIGNLDVDKTEEKGVIYWYCIENYPSATWFSLKPEINGVKGKKCGFPLHIELTYKEKQTSSIKLNDFSCLCDQINRVYEVIIMSGGLVKLSMDLMMKEFPNGISHDAIEDVNTDVVYRARELMEKANEVTDKKTQYEKFVLTFKNLLYLHFPRANLLELNESESSNLAFRFVSALKTGNYEHFKIAVELVSDGKISVNYE